MFQEKSFTVCGLLCQYGVVPFFSNGQALLTVVQPIEYLHCLAKSLLLPLEVYDPV